MLIRSMWVIAITIGVWNGPSVLFAQQPVLVSETFRESVRPLTKSAGSVFLGFHYGALDARPDLDALSAVLPPGDEPRLCLTLESQDGQYFGEASYPIPNRRSSPSDRVIRLATMHRALIESYSLHDLSVVAYLGATCAGPGKAEKLFVPVFLRRSRSLEGPVTMFVNSRSPGVLVQLFHNEIKRRSPCHEDPGTARRVAFNMACSLSLPPGTHRATLLVERTAGASVLEPESIQVYFP